MRYMFDRACDEHGIEHRLTKPYHPWTNDQAEPMNRTVKDATIKVFHYGRPQTLCAHVLAFVAACNFAKHLKHSNGAHPSEPSVKPTPLRSKSTRTTKTWDQTSRPEQV